jgi:transcriptional regulator with XRE-family HTH domain
MNGYMKKKDIEPRNQTLGEYVRARRLSLGLSYQDVADESGLHYSYWNKLENGHYEQPAPKYLKIIAHTLRVPIEDLYGLAGYDLPDRLPTFTPYLRAKYELPPEAVADLERYFDMLRSYNGIPNDQPVFPPKPTRSQKPSGEGDQRRAA